MDSNKTRERSRLALIAGGARPAAGGDGSDGGVGGTGARPSAGPQALRRRSLAVLHADAVDYSRMMCESEEATQRLLDACLDLLSAHLLEYGGTVCHFAGDAILATFDSVDDAVACAVDAQLELERRNRELPRRRRLHFRIGVNFAEVMFSRGEVFGVGVNVAARLQALSASGGLCFSESVRQRLRIDPGLEMVDLGPCHLKNIDEPVHAWRYRMKPRRAPAQDPRQTRALLLAAALGAWLGGPDPRSGRRGAGASMLCNLRLAPGAVTAQFGRRQSARADADSGRQDLTRLLRVGAPCGEFRLLPWVWRVGGAGPAGPGPDARDTPGS